MSGVVRIPAERLPARGGRSLFHHENGIFLLFDIDGELHAIEDSCPHAGASLFSGRLDGPWLQCPAHGLRFDLATGCPAGIKGFGLRRHGISWIAGECHVVIADQEVPA
ncbi:MULTISPECIES: Rieske (2Fe-2S) protein [Pseudomonas]|uniref:Rieske 2Fe-2S domain-containing protein n=1 Tax=Pseudomonas nitroreducens TaxID=46680 RepID=A0ABS0KMN9_PSENT|nr:MULTISPECIES: Rieske 2Fe-2S domain-containing protein [Pseudomonas]MBG6289268.1 Rieske 2Fe-2S domain-containing protein [Pseudomonas nitroreducens]MCJ1877973.1 Rieske 2Fe-2S domain-containing protein [Pseudomonas nitroreducens]MCJ1894370.1 Rieske 2Fe-2S domain-containing protein [Pseudomonas nitroreducens]NMZ58884.1 Rieske 2Fe-2S domain-containing protein [Pseudomonas nitroreducens]NMZ73739.1 Rieske 2Fe-2S domain-containing protein [Pseudomonas nitroreducens]